jgi:2-polyprenyl-3-methyl-5-hydroxy-6-metoxy-1,4-benzoquinol methylase
MFGRVHAMTLLRQPDLSSRHRQPEIMDQPGLDAGEHAGALRGLGRINGLSRSAPILWAKIAARAREGGDAPLRVLDVASGGGDVLIRLACCAVGAGKNVRFEGCDLSPQAVEFARAQAEQRGAEVRFFVWDALGGPLPDGYDVVTCTLFLHHLDEASAVTLLRRMAAAARQLVLVDDLIRSRLGHALAWVGCHLLSRSRVVHFDGPASVAAAFTSDEAARLALAAGLEGARLERHWPQRYLLSWSRR